MDSARDNQAIQSYFGICDNYDNKAHKEVDKVEQCRSCKYSFVDNSIFMCKKRVLQLCQTDGKSGCQYLSMAPGMCKSLNMNDDCKDYKLRLICKLFG